MSNVNNSLLFFYLGCPDNQGRYLKDILSWSDEKLESTHDYIQWLFPTIEKSTFNDTAPTLDDQLIEMWKNSPTLKNILLMSAEKYYEFLKRNQHIWVNEFNHNHMRITRMLKSLSTLGMRNTAITFLNKICTMAGTKVNSESIEFWKNAVSNQD